MPSLKERVYRDVRDRLLAGEIGPGSTVSEASLAKIIGVSRTPVREALVRLEALGLIEQHPRVGTRVREPDRQDIADCFELREALECSVIRFSAARVNDAELTDLQGLLNHYIDLARRGRTKPSEAEAKAISIQANILDMAFHMKAVAASKNRRMVQMVSDVHLMTRILRRKTLLPTDSQVQRSAIILRQHHRILRALRRRDADAAEQATRNHVRWSMQVHLNAFDWYARHHKAKKADSGLYFPQDILGVIEKSE